MIYDFTNIVSVNKGREYFEHLVRKKSTVEIKKKHKKRTYKQNRYLHLILGYFALEAGYSFNFTKVEYFKKECNPDIFIITVDGKLGEVEDLRSTADLDTKEMTIAVDRFRNWSSEKGGIYLPSPNEHEYLQQIENEIEMNKTWI
jgi:hypothetical protein